MEDKIVANSKRAPDAKELAVNGGEKAIKKFTGKAKPMIGAEEFEAVADAWGISARARKQIKEIVKTDMDGRKPHLTRYYNPRPSKAAAFEQKAREIFGVKYALGVNSGTSALNTAYIAAGIGPGHEVIVPGYTFFATVAAVITAKAIPVIAEVDETLALDPKDVERKINSQTKAIIPVHMSGNCCDMKSIMAIAKKHNLMVIEDNAQACGGSYKGSMLGTIGHMGCFSLSSYKITGAGEAGMVLTNDEWLHIRALNQHDTAACWRPDRFAKERKPGELFCGQNYRMDEIAGAMNLIQIQKTVAQAKRYNRNMQRIANALDSFRDTKLRPSNDIDGDIGSKLILLAKDVESVQPLVDALKAEGVPCGGRGETTSRDWHMYWYWEHILEQKTATPEGCPFTCPYHKGPLPDYSPDMCPNTKDLLNRAIFVNINQWWNAADCKAIATAINKVCGVMG